MKKIKFPDPFVFEEMSAIFLRQALNQLCQFYNKNIESELEGVNIEDYGYELLLTALVLLFQCFENYLKKELIIISPELIVKTKVSNWQNKCFQDLHLYGFEDLLTKYEKVNKLNLTKKTKNVFQDLKHARNSIVHGIFEEELNIKKIINFIST
ncbi:TPA: hypothetical protein JBH43_08265, partial [Legionella pneumophila]|nr:hypothetical protein [Legionella pneumophila]